jgi:hypothetical protein
MRGSGLLRVLWLAGVVAFSASHAVSAAPSGATGVDWTSGVISVIGEGVPPVDGQPAKRRLLAKRAAIVDGYRKLAEAVQGVQVDGQTTVKELEVASDEVRTSVSGLVKGARIVDENITSDGAYEVRIELPLFGENSLANAVLESSLNRRRSVKLPEPPPVAEPDRRQWGESRSHATSQASAYTGIVVDARNLKAKAAMMPALLDEAGHELYLGEVQVSNDDLVAKGLVSYVKNLDDAKTHPRVGASPVIIRADRYQGPFHADLVLGNDAAAQLKSASASSGLLKKLAVVIVL